MKKRLYKVEDGKLISGVCGGLAEYFDIDPSLVRIVTALIIACKGVGLIAYIIAAIVLPTKSKVEAQNNIYEGESTSYYQ